MNHASMRDRVGANNSPRIIRGSHRVHLIGGRNNWRTHRPYRPTPLMKQEADRFFADIIAVIGGLLFMIFVVGVGR